MRVSLLGGFAAVASCVLSGVQGKWKPPADYEIAVSKNGRFFQETDGTPFFWQADTAWQLCLRLNHTEADAYLADRASKGFNVVLAAGFTEIGIDAPNRNGDLAFVDLDVSRPNEPYWAHIDSIVELAWTKHGIRVGLIPAWGFYAHDVISPGLFTPDNGGAFGRFIGERYPYLPKFLFADTNPFWADQDAIVDEYAAGGIPGKHPSVDFRGTYDAVANGIVAGERAATRRGRDWWPLITMHPRNQWMPDAPPALASANLGDRAYLTLDAAQSGHVDIIPHAPVPWWNARRGYETVEVMWASGGAKHGRARPVLDNEPHYERRWARKETFAMPWNASDVRAGSWQTALCGAAGVTYGNDMVWQMYAPELMDAPNSGTVAPWYEAIDDAGAAQMQFIKKTLVGLGKKEFYGRVPAQDIIVGDAGIDDKRVTAMKDSNGSWIVVYTPTVKAFTINISSIKSKAAARWLNPLNGKYTSFKYEASGKKATFTPPKGDGHVDWVLVLTT